MGQKKERKENNNKYQNFSLLVIHLSCESLEFANK